MKYNFNGKMVNIPDKEIEIAMKNLELTKEEAIEMWLDDEGYTDNEEQNALDEKSKENKVKIRGDGNKRTNSKPKIVKVSDEKKTLFAEIWSSLQYEFGENAEIIKENKLISVKINDKVFKIDIIETRQKK